jgi:hypothetical protein
VLKLYRWPYDDWRSIGEELPPEIIWIDLISPSAEEKQFVESRLKIPCAVGRIAKRDRGVEPVGFRARYALPEFADGAH